MVSAIEHPKNGEKEADVRSDKKRKGKKDLSTNWEWGNREESRIILIIILLVTG